MSYGFDGAVRSWVAKSLLAVTLLSSPLALGASPEECALASEPLNATRYSPADVIAGRVPTDAGIARTTLSINGKRVDAAIVTDAARDRLTIDWPPFQSRTRLMLVALASGDVLRELGPQQLELSDARVSADARLTAPLGAAAVLTRADGVAYRLYAGDHAGRVWRVDLPPLTRASDAATLWRVTLLADLAPTTGNRVTGFSLAPDLVRSVDEQGRPFDGILLASGRQGATPDSQGAVGGGLFFLRDYAVSVRPPGAEASPVITASDLMPAPAARGAGAGWVAAYQRAGEVARHSPHTDGGRVFLMTAAKTAGCDRPAVNFTYIFNLSDGRPLTDTLPGSVAGVGQLGGPGIDGHDILLPGRGIAVPLMPGEIPRYRARFHAVGVFTRVSYWRDLLLDAD